MCKKSIFDYIKIVGNGEINNILNTAKPLRGLKIQHINSTKAGGGVAEILNNLVPMLGEIGMENEWSVITGSQDFFKITKKMHNSLHGKKEIFKSGDFNFWKKSVLSQKKVLTAGRDIYVIHDPQPLPLVKYRKEFGGRWIWRCHIDLSTADRKTWNRISGFVKKFDAAVFHSPKYTQRMKIPQFIFPPTIDPLSSKNVHLDESKIDSVRKKYGIPPDRPVLFDRLKDPFGAVEAFKIVRKSFPAVLILAGSYASDDPEGEGIFKEVKKQVGADSDIFLLNLPLTKENPVEVNALQRIADICLQMSVREGFGLTVAEALWKGAPVVARNSSGILMQVIHGINGFIVMTPQGAAFRINQLLSIEGMRRRMGRAARENVKTNFLLPNTIQDWVCCFNAVMKRKSRGIVEL